MPQGMDHLRRLAGPFLGIFEEHRYDGRCDVPIDLHGDTTLDGHAYHRPAAEPEFVLVMGRDDRSGER